MKLIALLLSLPAWRVAATAATSPEYAGPGAVYFANPIGEDFPVRRDPSEPSSRKLAVAAATSPGHVKDRYIVKLCETSWLGREPDGCCRRRRVHRSFDADGRLYVSVPRPPEPLEQDVRSGRADC